MGLEPVGVRRDVDDLAEAGMRDRAVVALEVVLDGDLPVARELELAPAAEAELLELDSARGEELRQRAERLGERRRLGIRVDEQQRAPGLDRQLAQADPVELELRAARCGAQPAVELVGPRVVGALQRGAVASTRGDERAAVAADVQQGVQLAVAVARDHDRHVSDGGREEVARLRSVLGWAGVLPAVTKDALLLPPQQLGIGVPAPRKRALRSPGGQIHADYRRRREPGTLVLRPSQCVGRPRRQSRHGLLVGVASERLILAARWTSSFPPTSGRSRRWRGSSPRRRSSRTRRTGTGRTAFPRELFGKLAELGFMGVCIPEEYGGAGADFLSYILVLEELSRADAGVGVTVAVHTSAVTLPILGFGGDEQRSRFIPPLARGEAIGAFALTEPEAGSDAGALRTAAVAGEDGWTITGTKQWITNGGFGGTVLLFARTDPETPGPKGISAFVLDGDQVRVTREEEKLGLNSSSTVDLAIEGARVSRDRLLHEEGKGFNVAMSTLDGGRIGIAAQALGIAQAAYDVAREYALERRQFGQRIAEFQAIQWKLADMATQIDAARLLVYRAAWLKQEGRPHTEAGAKAKLFASELARRQTAEAIQVLGGYGYTKEFPVERYYRDAKITEIYEGTSEIQRLVIARSILGLRERELAQG